ncbi:type III PLP-dependent enzyme [Zavarzinia compransoris]|uniref:ornithine decarboxylase n=1 Tax=Zavarzinia compransoris TaxID=1264899 RepID=A0A317EAH3_9PROT|nr:type III PLP-dependent enzyme [Zavarzinia compransoris]PWR23294.1 ornithine decarboxylase [Zavarzinia compransoris]TDP46136.1 ornithine decarboxylase [Zavarzinia compransoris]
MTEKIRRFLDERRPATPCLVVDLDVIEDNYSNLHRLLPAAKIFYAVKANPMPDVVARLNALGSSFDTASRGEIELVLDQGADPANVSFGNTIKKETDIATAYALGVRLFAFDSEAELEKLARSAPGSRVFCRVLVECEGAEWPLSRKFGCTPQMAADLMVKAREKGLDPYGISFHVGSQQTDLGQWDKAVGGVASLFSILRERDVELRMINLGGGFPAKYRADVPPLEAYAAAVMDAIYNHFGNAIPDIIIEPGRSMAGDAGILQTEVVLISKKDEAEDKRWIYLDVGKFSGLAETMDEAIKYRLRTPHDGGATAPVILAGPTCDSADILYEKASYELPVDLKIGDKIEILATGAYTTSYSSVNFNGFAPLNTICI